MGIALRDRGSDRGWDESAVGRIDRRCEPGDRVSALAALDEADPLGNQPYTLEVSSPGVDRPLTLPRHWRRNAGRLVKVTLDDGTQLTGRIVGSDEETARVDVSGIERPVPLARVKKAKVQIEFNAREKG